MRKDGLLCWKCREVVPYSVIHRKRVRTIGGKDYEYQERIGRCDICGEEITVPGLMDENERVLDNLYRADNDLITVDEINEILEKYNIEKRPLSHVLGMGEHTISRYVEGALPSKKYSDFLKRVLKYHSLMREKLEMNRESITETAYKKTDEAISAIENLCTRETKLELFALYIIHKGYDVTNLSLQKLLYYIKPFSYILLGRDIIENECEAWAYGPVFPEIYEKYKGLGSGVIDDYDKSIDYDKLISPEEKGALDYVVDNFGIFNGKVLMKLTHKERPWLEARAGIPEFASSRNVISEDVILDYFSEADRKYNLKKPEGVKNYIQELGII